MSFEPISSAIPGLHTALHSNSTMTTTLPHVNFGFDELKDRMARFTVNFDEFIEKGRNRILEERNEFAKNVVEDKGIFYLPPKFPEIYRLIHMP